MTINPSKCSRWLDLKSVLVEGITNVSLSFVHATRVTFRHRWTKAATVLLKSQSNMLFVYIAIEPVYKLSKRYTMVYRVRLINYLLYLITV